MRASGLIKDLALALLCVASALLMTLGLQHIATRVYFILFVPAVMFSTWFGGPRAGMLASVLTMIATLLLLPRAEIADQFAWLVVAGVIAAGTSVLTEKRRRAEALLQAQARDEHVRRLDAEATSQMKTDLLAQVVHELRQPLGAMSTALWMLEGGPNEEERQRALKVMGRQTNQLRRLVDDLLDASLITRRKIHLKRATIDLCEVAEDSVHIVAQDAAARRVRVSSSLPDCPVHLTADPTRIRQVVSNLLSNAVKFTPEGGQIELIVEESASQVVIRVRDTGRGISADHLQRIFDMFHKGDGESAGLGIGLAVVKGLVELHGGSVVAHSNGPGQGSEFVVMLPSTLNAAA